jgi:hypothetical protein
MRQRSFSIDETREQLRQGRPVHRDAVISGAADIRSLAYGDEVTSNSTISDRGSSNGAKKENLKDSTSGNRKDDCDVSKVEKLTELSSASTSSSTQTPVENVNSKSKTNQNPQLVSSTDASTSTDNFETSKQSIAQNTWAAMIKSSSENQQDTATQMFTTRAVSTSSKQSQADIKGDSGNKKSLNPASKSKGGPNEKKERRRKKKENVKGDNDALPKSMQTSSTLTATATAINDSQPISSWGGKASFANILKSTSSNETTER